VLALLLKKNIGVGLETKVLVLVLKK